VSRNNHDAVSTLILSGIHVFFAASFERHANVRPIHTISELDKLLGMFKFQGYGFERLFVLRIFGK